MHNDLMIHIMESHSQVPATSMLHTAYSYPRFLPTRRYTLALPIVKDTQARCGLQFGTSGKCRRIPISSSRGKSTNGKRRFSSRVKCHCSSLLNRSNSSSGSRGSYCCCFGSAQGSSELLGSPSPSSSSRLLSFHFFSTSARTCYPEPPWRELYFYGYPPPSKKINHCEDSPYSS